MKRSCVRIDGDVDLLALHASDPDYYPFLMQSSAAGTEQGRFDILCAAPGERLCLESDGRLSGSAAKVNGDDFLDALGAQMSSCAIDRAADKILPFCSGWFVYLGYELAGQIEPSLRLHQPNPWPIAFAVRTGAAVIRDNREQELFVCGERQSDISRIIADIARVPVLDADAGRRMVSDIHEDPAPLFIDAVEKAQAYIHLGEIYQANLSREWRAMIRGPFADEALYRRLSVTNPGPFSSLVRWNSDALLSSSPERLFCIRDRMIQTRPIAGTRPRGATPEQDAALMMELLTHPKEIAEHVMLIDLERNDLGRVCKAGSVHVDEYMVVESYAQVHHIVSNIVGELLEEMTAIDAIRAVFPGGTITGCPKVRCMEIIAELEQCARGPYTGSLGYIDLDGDCDFNILIRTLVRSGRMLSVRAGAGIVADSEPIREVGETYAKALGLLHALGEAR